MSQTLLYGLSVQLFLRPVQGRVLVSLHERRKNKAKDTADDPPPFSQANLLLHHSRTLVKIANSPTIASFVPVHSASHAKTAFIVISTGPASTASGNNKAYSICSRVNETN